jgi:hypothetical protein
VYLDGRVIWGPDELGGFADEPVHEPT